MNSFTAGAHRHAPTFDILGSYFPSWLICFFAASAITLLAHWIFSRTRLEQYLWPLPLVYPSLVCAVTCFAWLTFFA